MLKSIISVNKGDGNKVDRNCRICRKTFCCSECRDRHVDKVHPGLNGSCFLCATKTLPMRQFESERLDLENERLLYHIINNHLPLHCRLCGDTFQSREDFKFFGACKWWSRHCLTSPVAIGNLEKKLKCSINDSDYNDKFYTPSEIYRKTSTPMLAGQKASVEYSTPGILDFNLKTPKTSSSSIVQCNGSAKTYESSRNASETRDTEFFSFSAHMTSEETPFKISTAQDDQLSRTNSGRKLNVMAEREKAADDDKSATANGTQLSPVNMDLTNTKNGISRDSPQLDPISEEPDKEVTPEAVKRVRFSDEHKALPEFEERMKPCVKRTILNASMDGEDDEFHDAQAQAFFNAKNAEGATKEHPAWRTTNGSAEDREENAKCDQGKDEARSLGKSLQSCLNDLHVGIIGNNVKKDEREKENRESEMNAGVSTVTVTQQGTRLLMMVLVENNSGGLSGDLMPLIGSGLKKLQEQLASANQSTPIESSGSSKLHRQSITKMQMTVSSVENYTVKDTVATTTDYETVPSSSSAARNNNERNGGFLSSFAQAVKYALRSFSGSNVSPNGIETASQVVQQRKSMGRLVTRPVELFENGGSSSSNVVAGDSSQVRKRARDVTEVPTQKRDLFGQEGRSPLAKRHRWYTMIKGRKPIGRMRSNDVCATSPRGVSTGTQIFSQGALTVGDTVLPLPARAHQSTQTE